MFEMESDPNSLIRNQAMLARVDALLKAQTSLGKDGAFPTLFFAVGSAHLVGKDATLVDLLRQKGWIVESVPIV